MIKIKCLCHFCINEINVFIVDQKLTVYESLKKQNEARIIETIPIF